MVQIRIMDDDGEHVREIMRRLVPLLEGSDDFVLGTVKELRYSDDPDGARLTLDVRVQGWPVYERPARVRAERADRPSRRSLPPGRR
ncbi:hypothetical protein [Nonomuraea dietziae]|uniref:hypothetical protein n=1 Tax=Nonomuraea dietziae TaxID=65515 RepID=UPI0033E6A95E